MEQDHLQYSIALQRAIEYHCRGELIPESIYYLCPHHSGLLNSTIIENNNDIKVVRDVKRIRRVYEET